MSEMQSRPGLMPTPVKQERRTLWIGPEDSGMWCRMPTETKLRRGAAMEDLSFGRTDESFK
jgi:hypothetical protein